MDTNVVGSNTTGIITVSTDTFIALYTAGAGSNSTQSVASLNVMPIAGTFKNFYIQCDAGPGVGITRTFWVYKNGANTGITIALTGAGSGPGITSGSDLTDMASFAVGDVVSIHTTATATTTSTGTIRWCLDANSSTANQSMVLSNSGSTVSATATSYVAVSGKTYDPTAGTNVQGIMPTNGTLRNAYLTLGSGGSPGTGNGYTATLYQNGSPSAITITVSGSNIAASDNTHSVTVNPGDVLYWAVTPSGTPTARTVVLSMEFDPTINGESVHMYGSSVADTNSAVRYNAVTSPNLASYQSTETARQVLTLSAVWRKLYVNLLSAPGGSASFQVQLSLGGTAGSPTVTISSTNTTGSDSNNAISTAGQTVAIKMTQQVRQLLPPLDGELSVICLQAVQRIMAS